MSFSYPKKDKLKGKKRIEELFVRGESLAVYPLRMVYLKIDAEEAVEFKVGVTVSKKHFKKAVNRNQIKRLMREAYRLHRNDFFSNKSASFALMILYLGKDIPDFISVEKKMKALLNKFSKKELLN